MNQKNVQSLDLEVGDQGVQQMVTRKIAVLKRQSFLASAIAFCGIIVLNVITYREHAEKIRTIEKDLRRLQASVAQTTERQSATEQSDTVE